MARRKGEVARMNERDFPHLVELPPFNQSLSPRFQLSSSDIARDSEKSP